MNSGTDLESEGLKAPRRGTLRVFASLASAALISGYWYSRMGEVDVAREHGPMENFQVICLLLASVGFWRESRLRQPSGEKHFYRLGALGCLTMFLLEFDVRPFQIHLLTTLLNGVARNVWLVCFGFGV